MGILEVFAEYLASSWERFARDRAAGATALSGTRDPAKGVRLPGADRRPGGESRRAGGAGAHRIAELFKPRADGPMADRRRSSRASIRTVMSPPFCTPSTRSASGWTTSFTRTSAAAASASFVHERRGREPAGRPVERAGAGANHPATPSRSALFGFASGSGASNPNSPGSESPITRPAWPFRLRRGRHRRPIAPSSEPECEATALAAQIPNLLKERRFEEARLALHGAASSRRAAVRCQSCRRADACCHHAGRDAGGEHKSSDAIPRGRGTANRGWRESRARRQCLSKCRKRTSASASAFSMKLRRFISTKGAALVDRACRLVERSIAEGTDDDTERARAALGSLGEPL